MRVGAQEQAFSQHNINGFFQLPIPSFTLYLFQIGDFLFQTTR